MCFNVLVSGTVAECHVNVAEIRVYLQLLLFVN